MDRKPGEIDETSMREVAEAFASLKTADDVRRFLGELCTPSECRDIALRWHLMKRLLDGVPQRAIAKDLGLSLCKITRGSKYMKDEASLFRRLVLRCLRK
ncbi:MAG: Trp family transcriptional regulator [Kiritimatiellae bacterium]|jgi:TrpR family trp operon transcriptional repressor|nr:Trp family transcriptional regulator [Kiritimatiellia bacterium]